MERPFALIAFILIAGSARAHDEHEHRYAFGQPGQAAKVTRTVTIDMADSMRYTPSNVTARRGETIRFLVTNSGKLKHEFVLGSMKELKEHAALMQKFPEMEHADPNQVSVEAGKKAELIWQFSKAGKFDFACLQPGHFEAGMKGQVNVK
ncbi:MAG: cupredoxin family protein [Pseudomonadota bacterium]